MKRAYCLLSKSRLVFALTVCAATARADVETADFTNIFQFDYKIDHMPDLDQRRATAPGILGLPNDGSVHCAPTSTLNLMIYCANHGFPEVWPGPGNYQSGLYNVATLNDLALGISMETGLPNGTGGQALFDGTKSWLTQSAPGRFTVSSYWASGNEAPTLTMLAQAAINGSIVSIGYGRYSVIGQFGDVDVLARDGGHCVTLSRALRNGNVQTLAMRDPADSSDSLFSQSDFGNREVTATDRAITTAFSLDELRVVSALAYDVNKSKNAYIDRYVAIKPKQGYSWQSSLVAPLSSEIKIFKVASFLGGVDSGAEQSFAVDGTVIDAVISPEQTSILMVQTPKAGGATELLELNLLDGKTSKIATVPDAKSLHFSRHRKLYVAAPNLISIVDLVEKKVVSSKVPPFPVAALAYDDKTDDLVLLCSDAKKLVRWHDGLLIQPCIFDLSSLVMGGASTLAIDPTDGEVFFATEKSSTIFAVTDDGSVIPCIMPWDLTGFAFPTALDLDDMGHLFVAAGAKLVEFEFSAAAGWQPLVSSPFTGLSVGTEFRVTRSRSNYNKLTMSGPEWRDLDPSQLAGLVDAPFIPDCDGAPSNLEYGAGKAGEFGVPHLVGLDLPTLGTSTSIQLSNGRPGALPVLFLGTQQAALPFDGGVIHLVPAFVLSIPAPIAVDGTLTLSGVLPGDAALCGLTLYHQMLFVDPLASGFYNTALTNGLARTLGS